ncbi:hypothetical protein DRQ33_08100, partial [bacterium]
MRNFVIIIGTVSFLLFGFAVSATFRDMLFLRNGEELRCNISKITHKQIYIETADGQISFPIEDVLRITLTHPRPGDNWKTLEDIDDSLLIKSLEDVNSIATYPNASYIILNHDIHYRFNPDSSGRYTERLTVLILTERGKSLFATNSFYFLAPWQHGDVDFCRTITGDANVFHLNDAALEFSEPEQYYPQYNFLRRIKFAPPQISIGAIIDYQYHIDYDIADPVHPIASTVIFGGDEPILHREFIVEYPASLGDKFVRHSSFAVPERTEDSNMIRIAWQQDDIEPFISEPWTAPLQMFLPTVWIGFCIDEAKMLRALTDSLKKSLDGSPELDHFTDSLVTGYSGKREALLKIYEYLNLSYRKANIPIAHSRLFPRRVSDIFNDGIANSLDICALMIYMLQRVGIDGKLLYCSSILDRAAISDVPSLAYFSTPLIVAQIDGENIFCAPQMKYVPSNIIPTECDGQVSLWVGTDGAQMVNLPINKQDIYAQTDTFRIDFAQNGDANVEIEREYGAKSGAHMRAYREIRKEQLDRELQTKAGSFHPGTKLDGYMLTGIGSLDSMIMLNMNLSVPQLAQTAGKKLIAFQIPELIYSSTSVSIPERETPIW